MLTQCVLWKVEIDFIILFRKIADFNESSDIYTYNAKKSSDNIRYWREKSL